MSCGCNSGYDGGIYGGVCNTDTPYPSVSHESVPSLIDNLVYALYGVIQKDVTSGKVVWDIPCDPNKTAQITNVPRYDGEGLLCYIIRGLNYAINYAYPVTLSGVQTLSNKTLDASCYLLGNAETSTTAITATSALNIYGGSAGSLPYQSSAGSTTLLPQGTAGQVLSTNGAGLLGWITNSTTSSATNNINGGNAGEIVYQSGVNTTGFSAVGTAGQVLLANGTSAPTWSTNIAGNSGTATQLQTSRTLGISGDVTGTASFDGSANATIAGTISNGVVTSAKLGTNEQKQLCKAWGGATSGGVINALTYGVNTIARSALGNYLVTMTTAINGYSVVGSADSTGGFQVSSELISTTQFKIYTFGGGGAVADAAFRFAVFGV